MQKTSWQLNSTDHLADLPLSAEGNPQVVAGPRGPAVAFAGTADGLFADSHPLQGMEAFTIEIVFRPERGGLAEQRFFHIGDPHGDRVLFETRLTDRDEWYLDTFISSGASHCTLLNEGFLHPLDAWYHLAMSCDGGEQINYVDGHMEQRGPIEFTPLGSGALSIGVRLNRVCWFKGAIAEIHVTPEALGPEQFNLL